MSALKRLGHHINRFQRDVRERRSFPRERVEAPIGVARSGDSRAFECAVHDISATGALLTPRLHAGSGERLRLELESPDIALDAAVVDDSSRGTAVMFDSPQKGAVVTAWLKGTAAARLQDGAG